MAIIHVAAQIIHPGWMIIHHHPIIHPSGTSLKLRLVVIIYESRGLIFL